MFKSPYDTTPLSGHVMNKTLQAVEKALVMDHLVRPVPELQNLYAVSGKDIELQQIPAFTHTLELQHRGQSVYVMDLRPYDNTLSKQPEGIQIVKGTPAELVLKLATLQMIWQKRSDDFIPLMELPLSVYASWIGNALTSKLGLDPAVSLKVRALAAWFFNCQHVEPYEITDNSIAPKILRISKCTAVPAETVIEVIREAGFLNNLRDFCEALQQLPSAKLERIDPAFIIQTLGNSWHSTSDPRSLVAVSLEFPPYFYALVHTSVTERYFRKTTIALVTENFDRADRFRTFDIQVRRLLSQE